MRAESECRRPEFQGGIPVTLADGNEWLLPRPRLYVYPKFVDGKPQLARGCEWGPDYLALLDAAREARNGDDFLLAQFALAIDLLRRNYDLSDDELAELLRTETDGEASQQMWEEVSAVAAGAAPKSAVTGTTSTAPSGPTASTPTA